MSGTRTATTRELASVLYWFGSALAGKNERPVRILERFAGEMGPSEGPSEVLISRRRTG